MRSALAPLLLVLWPASPVWAAPEPGNPVQLSRDEGVHQAAPIELWSAHGFVEGPDGTRYAVAGMLVGARWMGVSMNLAMGVVQSDARPQHLVGTEFFNPLGGSIEHSASALNERFGKSYVVRKSPELVEVGIRTPALSVGLRAKGGSAFAPLCGTGEARWADGAIAGYSVIGASASGRLEAEGTATPLRGKLRFDHLWAERRSNDYDLLTASLEDGRELTVVRVHPDKGPGSCAAITDAAGSTRALSDLTVSPKRSWTSPRTETHYPVQIAVQSSSPLIDVQFRTAADDQEIQVGGFSFYHGACAIQGSIDGKPVAGKCFLVLFGSKHPVEEPHPDLVSKR